MSLDAAEQYAEKPARYFANARHDMVAMLPDDPQARVVEIGCGEGGTGAAALAAGKAAYYLGIELSPTAAKVAQDRLSEVIVGNAESLNMQMLKGPFDAVILSEVAEHLVDPWSVANRLAAVVRPGGMLLASSPNIAQWGVVRRLVRGEFDYTDVGTMDRTHLRWFTPKTYCALFEQAGFEIVSVMPIGQLTRKRRLFNLLTARRFAHLTMNQIMVIGKRR